MLFEDQNVDELSNKIQMLVNNHSLMNEITSKALRVTENTFETTKQFEKLEKLLKECLYEN